MSKKTKASKATAQAEAPASPKDKKAKPEAATPAAKPAKAPKEKAPAATPVPAADPAAEAKKAARAARKEARANRPVRTPVNQEPTEVTPVVRLKKDEADLLLLLHGADGPQKSADIATVLGVETKVVTARSKALIEAGLVVKDETTKELEVIGKNETGFARVLDLLRAHPEGLTSAKIGKLLWADPKNPHANDTVRFGRAAGRIMTAAFQSGLVKQFTQPRRKFSDAKIRKIYRVGF